MTAKFVVTAPTINNVIDGYGPDFSRMSVVPHPDKRAIDLVIGTKYEHADACGLSKEGLNELIDILTDIHEAMVD
jgi:hypothetical protein